MIEGLLALVLLTGISITLALTFPAANKNVLRSRRTTEATRLAGAFLANLKNQPYAFIDTNSPDCGTADFTALPSTATLDGGTTFLLASCVDFVAPAAGNTWLPQSTDSAGYKRISVRVWWTQGTEQVVVKRESSITRY